MDDDELCVLTRVIDSSDPNWDCSATVIGTLESIKSSFDLSKGVPFGWRLLRGKQARRFLKRSLREEARYQAEQALRKAGGGDN
jgi:hypothetical protein